MPEFDIDAALMPSPVPACDDCRSPMEFERMEADDYFGTAVAVFHCPVCADPLRRQSPAVYRRVKMDWRGSQQVQGGEPRPDRPSGDFFGCPCCDSDGGSSSLSEEVRGSQIRIDQMCVDCGATWTDVFEIREDDHA